MDRPTDRINPKTLTRVTRIGSSLGVKRGIAAKGGAQMLNKVNQIGARVDPIMQIGDGDEAARVYMGVGAFDDHVARGVDVDAGRVAGVGVEEPDDDGDVVGDSLEGDGDGAVGLEEVDGAAVVVGEGGGFGVEGGEGFGEVEEVLPDEPLGVFRVRQGGGAPLGEHRA